MRTRFGNFRISAEREGADMSHRWDCPTPWTAEREGERAFERGEGSWRNPYRDEQPCEDAERAWQRGYQDAERQQEERRVQERAERRRAQARAEEAAYWRQEEERLYYEGAVQEQYEAEMRAQEEDYYDQMFWNDVLLPTFEEPRWADDGGPSL